MTEPKSNGTPQALEILFEDATVVAVDKPSGLLVHPQERISGVERVREATLLALLRNRCGEYLFPVHRIDRATSGVVLFAKRSEAASELCRQFESHAILKHYVALVRGWMKESTTLSHPVWNESESKRLDAVTEFTPLERFEVPWPSQRHPTARYTLLRASPKSGRYHQIRQHCKHLAHPIIGDTMHGDGVQNRMFRAALKLHRLFLHAVDLAFYHPSTGEKIVVAAPLPPGLMEVLEGIRQ